MAIRRQQLQDLQRHCASDNDRDNKNHAVGVSEGKRKAQQGEGREMLNPTFGKHGTGVDRRQGYEGDECQRQPARNLA